MRVGLISDTHGLLRPEVIKFLEGSQIILHGGDVGKEGILDELEAIAPTHAVRGNVDMGDWAHLLPLRKMVEIGPVLFHMVHIIEDLRLQAEPDRLNCVLFGHSHQPDLYQHQGVIHVNPGSAGPRRFRKPLSIGELVISDDRAEFRLFNIEEDGGDWQRLAHLLVDLPQKGGNSPKTL